MRRIRRKRWYALALLVFVLILFYGSNWLGRLMYPIPYKKEIEASAAKYEVDPLLVAAIIRVETNFKQDQISKKGAIGIMQIMPDTAQWIFGKDGFQAYTLTDLNRTETNIKIGTKYLSLLHQQFQNDRMLVIAAYNAGPGNVSKWVQTKVWNGKLDTVESIPFWETRNYVNRVVYYYKKYEKIYSN